MGSQPTKVTITFEQDFAPPVFKVDERLAEVGWLGGWVGALEDRVVRAVLGVLIRVGAQED